MAAIERKTPPELARMRKAGRLVAETLRLLSDIAEPGVTTAQLDEAAADYIADQGAEAAFKGYRGFPASICTSLNEEIVHGIPGPRKLREGDLLKVDVGVIWEGYYGDAAATVPVGDVGEQARELLQVTREALNAGIAELGPDVKLSEVSRAIQDTAESHGFSVVREYTGHGIGKALHEDPKVPNFVSRELLARDIELKEGMTIAVEPMVNLGAGAVEYAPDGWTVRTRDRLASAHFEHTLAVTADGVRILTQ